MEAKWIPFISWILLLLFLKEISSHGAMQMPLSWQVGNTQVDLGENSCVSGACNWFTNWTRLSPNQPATIPQDSPLRTFSDVPPLNEDWTARNPWRAPGRAKVYSPCGSEGGNPFGCVQADGKLGPCTIDDGAFAFGSDGRALGGMGVITSWQQGSIVEVGWSIRSNHGGGYSYRLCKKPTNGNFSELTEECFAAGALDFVGNTSFIVYHDTAITGGGKRTFEIDAVRTTNGTYPPGSMWTRNPIPCFGHGPDIQGQGTQFPLPTLHGKTVVTPTALSGFCPCRHPGGDAYTRAPFLHLDGASKSGNQTCYCCCGCCMDDHHAPVSFDEWTIVDKVLVPPDLTVGEYVLGFRWDCEQSPQVWQQCASINVTSKDDPEPHIPLTLAPVCGDSTHGCCLEVQSDNKTGARTCKLWSGVNTCTLTPEHCENGTQRIGIENIIHGCHGTWMPEVDPQYRCTDPTTSHVCGFECSDTTGIKPIGEGGKAYSLTDHHNKGGAAAPPRACMSYAAPGPCTKDRSVCEEVCRGEWLRP